MESKSHQVAAIVGELEAENIALRKEVARLNSLLSKGAEAIMAHNSGVLVPLPPPKELAFGQRWAFVFTIMPNNPRSPSIDDLFCELHQPVGTSMGNLSSYGLSFGWNELPEHAWFLGTLDAKVDD